MQNWLQILYIKELDEKQHKYIKNLPKPPRSALPASAGHGRSNVQIMRARVFIEQSIYIYIYIFYRDPSTRVSGTPTPGRSWEAGAAPLSSSRFCCRKVPAPHLHNRALFQHNHNLASFCLISQSQQLIALHFTQSDQNTCQLAWKIKNAISDFKQFK